MWQSSLVYSSRVVSYLCYWLCCQCVAYAEYLYCSNILELLAFIFANQNSSTELSFGVVVKLLSDHNNRHSLTNETRRWASLGVCELSGGFVVVKVVHCVYLHLLVLSVVLSWSFIDDDWFDWFICANRKNVFGKLHICTWFLYARLDLLYYSVVIYFIFAVAR